ncbi:class I SAM-dependent methyltransferase [bacterium]|nr:class I SAM-dependent methyltransferase [candidate division CSSED10-310 bacterium]
MSAAVPWQLKIFSRTLKKKEKWAILRSFLPATEGKRCLDLGCARGTISYFLKTCGGIWIHEDLDFTNVLATRNLVGPRAAVIPEQVLPHSDDTFNVIVSLDILEHVHDDRRFVQEMARVLKPEGRLILSTPATGPVYLLNRLKNRLGLTPDIYGHVVEGYTLEQLESMLTTAGFAVEKTRTYSRFFTEAVELMINLVFVKLLRGKKDPKRDGYISPGSAADVARYRKQLRFYSAVYPVVWVFTRLDGLLWWQKGYATLLVARKKAKP